MRIHIRHYDDDARRASSASGHVAARDAISLFPTAALATYFPSTLPAVFASSAAADAEYAGARTRRTARQSSMFGRPRLPLGQLLRCLTCCDDLLLDVKTGQPLAAATQERSEFRFDTPAAMIFIAGSPPGLSLRHIGLHACRPLPSAGRCYRRQRRAVAAGDMRRVFATCCRAPSTTGATSC